MHTSLTSIANSLQSGEHLVKVPEMLLICFTCKENIINVNTNMWDTSQDPLHGPLKDGRCGFDAKRKAVIAIQTLVCVDRRVLF